MADLHHWAGSIHGCCQECRSFYWHCPSCGTFQGRRLPDDGISFPTTGTLECGECAVIGTITLLGWKPATALQRAFDLPAARRPQPEPAKSRQGGNSSQKRLTLREWMKADPSIRRRVRAVNNAPRIREAHVRNGCAPTYRGGLWTYSRSELLAALDLISQRGARRG